MFSILVVISSTCGLAQLFYPANRALPLTTLAGEKSGFKSGDEIKKIAQEKHKNSQIEIIADESVLTTEAENLGIFIDEEKIGFSSDGI